MIKTNVPKHYDVDRRLDFTMHSSMLKLYVLQAFKFSLCLDLLHKTSSYFNFPACFTNRDNRFLRNRVNLTKQLTRLDVPEHVFASVSALQVNCLSNTRLIDHRSVA